MAPGEGALSARTVLEVADGLRWNDPRLGLSLAEHALRLAGDDVGARAAAQRSVIRSLAEVDRFEEVVSRATPLLEEAVVRQDRDHLAGLLVELAAAAMGFGDDAVATRLVAPVGPGEELPPRTTVHAALVRAELAGATGDVAGADRAAQDAEPALRQTAEPEAGLARRDLARARAAARSRSGDPASALPLLSAVVSDDPGADADAGRRSLLAAADQVGILVDLGRPEEALARGRAALPTTVAPPLVRPAARVRLTLAERIHLAHGAPDEARALARVAAEQLEDAGHDADAARAWEVVASAAERSGDLAAALTAVRHGYALDTRARDRRDPALRVLATLASSAPELPARPASTESAPTPSPAPRPAQPGPAPTISADVESLLADARSPVREEVAGDLVGAASPVRRRGHRRQGADAAARPSGTESVPETLARLLGTYGSEPSPGAGTTMSEDPGEGAEADPPRVAGRTNGVSAEAASPAASTPSRRRRPDGPGPDEGPESPAPTEAEAGARPTFDAFSTAPGRRTADATDAGPRGPGTEPSPPEAVPPGAEGPTDVRLDLDEFPYIDPADPLGSGPTREAPGRPNDGAAVTASDSSPGEETGRAVGPTPPEPHGSSGTSPDDPRPGASSRGPVPGPPSSRPGERDMPSPDRSSGTPLLGPPTAARDQPGGAGRNELDEELALTLAGLLAEYGAPDPSPTTPQDDVRPPDVAVPAARRHVSGSMPLPPTDQRFAARPAQPPDQVAPPSGEGFRRRTGAPGRERRTPGEPARRGHGRLSSHRARGERLGSCRPGPRQRRRTPRQLPRPRRSGSRRRRPRPGPRRPLQRTGGERPGSSPSGRLAGARDRHTAGLTSGNGEDDPPFPRGFAECVKFSMSPGRGACSELRWQLGWGSCPAPGWW